MLVRKFRVARFDDWIGIKVITLAESDIVNRARVSTIRMIIII